MGHQGYANSYSVYSIRHVIYSTFYSLQQLSAQSWKWLNQIILKMLSKLFFLKICVSFKHNWRVIQKRLEIKACKKWLWTFGGICCFFFFLFFLQVFFRMGTHKEIRVRSAIDIISSAQLNNQKFYIYLYSIPIFGIGVVIIVAACPYYWSCLWLHALCRKKQKNCFFSPLFSLFWGEGKWNFFFSRFGMECHVIWFKI